MVSFKYDVANHLPGLFTTKCDAVWDFAVLTYVQWQRLLAILDKKHKINLQGDSLTIPALVAVTR
jgi:hypothetical protein